MADTSIKLQITAEGMKERTAEAKALRLQLEGAANAAERLGKAPGTPGPGPGARTSNKLPAQGSTATEKSKSESQSYGVARSAVGTGAAGRDFAKQSEGLGGLVRVYATFAANLFAVGAAFTALSKAADTSNMQKGLEQLGAASGKNLNAMAAQMVKVTDGAISLKQAMEATAQASAGGISGDQLNRLTEVAKKSAQALGRDMPDALSRLTRGIIKIEPELLDELGIMVKVDEANQAYARGLGRTVSSLTDLEKRQAFANAAIAQGEKKFGDIELVSNPYSKVLASTSNLVQVGLELINKVLSPVLTLLSNSPTALAGALAVVGATLLKQAIPALGSFKEEMARVSEQAKTTAVLKSINAKKAQEAAALATTKSVEAAADAEIEALARAEAKIKSFKGKFGTSGVAAEITRQPDVDIQSADRLAVSAKIIEGKIKAKQLRGEEVASLQASAQAHREYEKAIRSHVEAEKVLETATRKAKEEIEAKRTILNTAKQNEIAANNALVQSATATIASRAAQTGSEIGLTAAMKEAWAAVNQARKSTNTIDILRDTGAVDANGKAIQQLERVAVPALGNVRSGWTLLRAGIGATTAAVGTFLNAFGMWAAIIGIVIGVLSTLADWLSKNTKEITKFSEAIDGLDSSAEQVGKSLDLISKKDALGQLSITSTLTKANAFNELSNSISAVAKDLIKVKEASNGFDKFINSVKSLWGGDITSKAAKGVLSGVIESLKLLPKDQVDELSTTLKDILNTSDLTTKGIKAAMKALSEEKADEAIDKISVAVDTANKKFQEQAGILTSLRASLSGVAVAESDIITALLNTDPIGKFAAATANAANSMSKSMNSTSNSLAVMQEIMSKPSNLAMFGSASSEIAKTFSKRIADASIEIAKLKKEEADFAKSTTTVKTNVPQAKNGRIVANQVRDKEGQYTTTTGRTEAEKAAKAIEIAEKLVVIEKKGSEDIIAAQKIAVEVSAKALASSMKNSAIQAGLIVAKASAAGLSGPGTASINYNLKVRELNLQAKQLQDNTSMLLANENNTDATTDLTAAITKNSDLLKLDALRKVSLSSTSTTEDVELADKKLIQLRNKLLNNDDSDKKSQELRARVSSITTKGGETNSPAEIFKRVSNALKQEQAKGAEASQDLIAKLTASKAKYAPGAQQEQLLIAEKQSALITRDLEVLREKATISTKEYQNKLTNISLDQKSISNLQDQFEIYSSVLQQNKVDLVDQKAKVELAKEATEYASLVAEFDRREKEGKIEGLKETRDQASKDTAKKTLLLQRTAAEEKSAVDKDTETRQLNEGKRLKSLAAERIVASETLSTLARSDEQAELSAASALGLITAKQLAEKTESLGIRSAEAEKLTAIRAAEDVAAEKRLANISAEKLANQQLETLKKEKAPKKDATEEETLAFTNLIATRTAAITELTNKTNESNLSALTTAITLNNAIYDSKVKQLEITKQTTLEQNKWSSFLDSMTKAFGKIGTGIGNITKTYLVSANKIKSIEEKKSKDIQSINDDTRSNAMDKLSDINIVEKKAAKDTQEINATKIDDYANMAGAAASMFEENSKAAKVFQAIQMGIHVAKLAMFATEQIAAWTSASTTVATEGIKATAAGKTAVAQAATLPPPFGWIAAGAMVAFLASMGIFKGSASVPAIGQGSEEKQKTQGTGQKYDKNGKIVSTGTGILGDDTAKSETLVKAIELSTKYAYEELGYSNKMLAALLAIKNSLVGVTKSLVLTTGITGGSAFGTTEGAKTRLGGSIFGGNTETKIIASGIQVIGSLKDIIAKSASAKQYETVSTFRAGGWFSKDKTSIGNEYKSLSDETTEALANTFSAVKGSLVEAGKLINIGGNTLADKLDSVGLNIDVELRGLVGKEREEAITSVISANIDIIAEAAFAILKPFQVLGEGLGETAYRLATEARGVEISLALIGKSMGEVVLNAAEQAAAIASASSAASANAPYVSGSSNPNLQDSEQYSEYYNSTVVAATALTATQQLLAVSDAQAVATIAARTNLINLLGGMEEFVSKTAYYADNFISETKKISIQTANVKSAFEDINGPLKTSGLVMPTTIQGFNDIVAGLDLLKEPQQKVYAELMRLAPAFYDVYKSTAQVVLTAKELTDSQDTLLLKMYELLGSKSKALTLTRTKELASMDALLRPLQTYIYALEDEVEARDALKTAYEEETSARQASIDKLKTSSTTLKDFINSLALGAQSPLNTEDKYAEATRQKDAVLAILNNAGSTAAQKDEALGKLPTAITAWLDSSKVANASSLAYQADYTAAVKVLNEQNAAITSQLSIEQQSLTALDTSVSHLLDIRANTKTTSELILALTNSINAKNTAAAAVGTAPIGTPAETLSEAFVSSLYNGGIAGLNPADTAGQQYWTTQLDTNKLDQGGVTAEITKILADIASKKINSDFVASLYNGGIQGLNKNDTEGQAYWSAQLDTKKLTQTGVVSEINTILNSTAGVITQWYRKALNKEPDAPGLAWWVAEAEKTSLAETKNKFRNEAQTILGNIPVPAFAKGGFMKGIAVVGERGPELVNFDNPGQVYTNDQSQNIMKNFNEGLAEEISKLRQEISQLKLDANRNAGLIIQSNYDANDKASDKINAAVIDAANIQTWQNRVVPA